jgi:hypothetical protein
MARRDNKRRAFVRLLYRKEKTMKLKEITPERRSTLSKRVSYMMNSPDSCDPVERNYNRIEILLKDAKSLIEHEEHWTKGAYAKRFERDAWSHIAVEESDSTNCFCAIGALLRAAVEYDDWNEQDRRQVYNSALNELGAAVRYIDWGNERYFSTLMGLNDNTNHACVLRAYDAVINTVDKYRQYFDGEES